MAQRPHELDPGLWTRLARLDAHCRIELESNYDDSRPPGHAVEWTLRIQRRGMTSTPISVSGYRLASAAEEAVTRAEILGWHLASRQDESVESKCEPGAI